MATLTKIKYTNQADHLPSRMRAVINYCLNPEKTKPEEMAYSLMYELSRGVTSLPATGMYTQEEKSMLLCVISRRQIAALKRIMKQIDPDAFAVMSNVSQVVGLGFYAPETEEN